MCILIYYDVETLESILTHTEPEYKVFPVEKKEREREKTQGFSAFK